MKKNYILLLFIFSVVYGKAQVCQVFITHMISGNQVQYYGSSPDNPSGWSWFFNGGSPLTASAQNPTPVTYSTNGTFITALSVYGGLNSCNSALSNAQDSVTITSTGIPEIKPGGAIKLLHQGHSIDIEISSSIDQKVSIYLYDLSGRMVDEIFTGMLKTGLNTFHMKAAGLADGTYLVQVNSEQAAFARKIFWSN